jgi:SnoaL-like domain
VNDAEGLAHVAIRDTLARCTQAGDVRKADAYAACFAVEGVLDLATGRIEGRSAIREWMLAPSVIPAPAGRAAGPVNHHLTTCRIDLTSAITAKARSYWLVITALGLDHSGYYDDEFQKIGADWLITYRRPRTLWKAAGSLVG